MNRNEAGSTGIAEADQCGHWGCHSLQNGGMITERLPVPKEDKRDLPIRSYSRQGEGIIIETSRKMVPLPNGASSFEIALDLGNAPVPERKYVADVASVKYEDGVLHVLFGQKSIGSTNAHLRTLIVISMSSLGALMFLRSLNLIRAQLDSLRDKPGYTPVTLPPIETEPAAPQTVALAANLIVVAFSGRESVIDFYHASAFVMSQIQRGGKFAVDPVVRVFLPTGLLFSVIAKMESFRADFPQDEIELVMRGSTSGGGQISEVRYGSPDVR